MRTAKFCALLTAASLLGCLSSDDGDPELRGTYVYEGEDYTDEFIFFSTGRFEYNGYEDLGSGTQCWNFRCEGDFELGGSSLTLSDRQCNERYSCFGDWEGWEDIPSFSGSFEWDGSKCFLWGIGASREQERFCKPD